MSLKNEYVKTGNWLFKYRGSLPIFILIPAIVFINFNSENFFSNNSHWIYICFCISLFGELIRILTVGYVPIGTSGRNTAGQSARSLNTTGIYSMVRHPLYLGNYFIWLGVVIFFNNIWLIAIISLIYFLYYERIMFAEEEFLINKFGEEYTTWANTTPAIVPDFKVYSSPNSNFSLRTVLLREYTGIGGIIVIFGLLNGFQSYCMNGIFILENKWIFLSSIGVIIYFLLRSLKKYTNYLNTVRHNTN